MTVVGAEGSGDTYRGDKAVRRTGPVGMTASLKTRGTDDLVGAWHRCAKRPPTGGPERK
jgi:hypothetical protein